MGLMLTGVTTVAVANLITTSGRMVRVAEDRHRESETDRVLRWLHRSIDRSEPAAVVSNLGGGSARIDLTIDGVAYRVRHRNETVQLVRRGGSVPAETLLDGVTAFTSATPAGQPPILTVVRDGRTFQRQLHSLRRDVDPLGGVREEAWW